ncbi:MAG TPA: type II secretion system F family protein [Acidimicrobiia bacterium]|nr:type II secretion system F family protein [Acidimicrobiia bacterium]
MRRRSAAIAIGAVLLILVAVPVGGAGEPSDGSAAFDFVDDSDFPTVHLVITPGPGTGPLDESDVTLTQDGEPIEPVVTPLRAEPIEIVLLIDTSGSMGGAPIAAAKQAATDFVVSLPPGSEVAVLGFGNEVSLVAALGSSVEELTEAIDALTAAGETALHDAVIAAAAALEASAETRQFMVLLSDGGDTASAAALDDVTGVLAEVDVGFYAIELAGSELDPEALAAMADAADGQVVQVEDSAALAGVYAEIAAEVVSQYAVSFVALHGGDSVIEVVIGSGASEQRFSSLISFPVPAGERSRRPVVTLTVPGQRTITPAPSRTIEGPSGLGQTWTLNVGVALVAITLLIVLSYALMPSPASGRRSSLLGRPGDRSSVRRRRRSGLFRRAEMDDDDVFRPRPTRGIEASLEAAGVALSATEYVLIITGLALTGAALSLLLGSLMLGLLLLVNAVLIPRLWLSRAADRRRAAFADQLEGNLQLIAGTLRAGYGLSQAVSTVAEEAPSPSRDEFGRVVVEIRLGRDLPDSLRATASRMQNEDFGWVADAIAIQQEVGGNLAEILDGVAATIRDRNNIRRQVHALSAEGRMSAGVLIALPIVLAFAISVVNPGYLDVLFSTPLGRFILGTGVVLMTIGVVWIRRLIRIVF